MNALHAAASRVFQQQEFSPSGREPSFYKAVSIDVSSSTSVRHDELSLSITELRDFVTASAPAQSRSRFRLVCFECTRDVVLQTTRAIFNHVFDEFGLHEYSKYMLCKRSTGFHEFRRQGPLMQFFLGMNSCRILYTYHIPSRSTAGILINDTRANMNPLFDLTRRLNQSANLAPHPAFLPCLCAVSLMHFAREATQQALGGIALLGQSRGIDIWASEVMSLDLNSSEQLVRLSNMADLIGPMLGELEHIRRYFIVTDQLLDGMMSDETVGVMSALDDDIVNSTAQEIDEVLELVKRQIDAEKKEITHWLERGKSQMSLVFNMITRSDVLASIQLAKAAAEDSSSMRVVAIMTMVFLPATFFAALFAVPSLKWDQESVIGDKFWMYWAFTLPTTAIVFTVWLALTRWDDVFKVYKELILRKPEK